MSMNSRSSSISVPAQRVQSRPSVYSRLSSAITNAEQGEATTRPDATEHLIDEEIEEIKRYEVRSRRLIYNTFKANLCKRTSRQ